jgi:hypothetical protein
MDAKSVVDSGRGRSGFRGGCSRRSGRRQPPIRHVLAGSLDARIRSASQVSLLKERKKNKNRHSHPTFFFFCSFARRVSPTSRCQTWKNFVHRRSFSLFHSEKQQKQKKDFFFFIYQRLITVLVGFSFNVMLIPRFFFSKKTKNCNPNTNLNSVKLLPFPPLPFNHTRTCFFFLLSLEFPHQSMAFEICVSRRQFHQETN